VPTGSLLGGLLMYVPARVWLYAQLIFLMCGGLVASAGQTTQEASSPDALKERVLQYYRLAHKGDSVAALAFVVPESKNDFFHMSYDGVQEVRILNVDLSDGGDKAAVKILRTDRFLGFPQLLDYETTETWKRIDGQWYILLPTFKEMDTPFGKMHFGGHGEASQTSKPDEMFRLRQTSVDPGQYLKGLQKVAVEAKKKQEEEKKQEEGKKPAEKKPEDQDAPKPKPPLQPQN
jgi:hypothetical protein